MQGTHPSNPRGNTGNIGPTETYSSTEADRQKSHYPRALRPGPVDPLRQGSSRRKPTLNPKALSEFCTLEQRNARSDEEMRRADEAALREAIARSLQERAFDVLVDPTRGVGAVPASYAPQRGATHAPRRNATHTGARVARIEGQQPTEVAELERELQMSAFADLHPAFSEHLRSHDLKVISNRGKGNSCAIYALVQQVRPNLLPAALDSEVKILRTQYDRHCPDDEHRMLHLDTGPGGAADTLIALINKRYGVNVQFSVVEAGVEPEHPVTRQGVFPPQASGASFSHRLVVWDQQGHYEAITGVEPGDAITRP